jgi:hypothetical protein
VNYLGQALCAFAMMGIVKRLDPTLPILAGGGLITSWMKRPGWRNPFEGIIDGLVSGPGEAGLLAALGLEWDGGPVLPDYGGVSSDLYLSPGLISPYSASSGCWWRRCAFCPEQAERNPYRPVPRVEAVSQLRSLVDRYRPSLVHLTDNALAPALMKTLARTPPGAPWYGFARMTPDLADPDFCTALRRSGCVMLQLGLESGSQRVLDAFGKGVDLGIVERGLASLRRAGIGTYVYLLFGTPWETEADAEQTLAFTARHHDKISFLNLAVFNLPAHGPEADSLSTAMFYDGDLSLYHGFEHPGGWDRGKVKDFLDKRFKRHQAVAAIIRRDPPTFTSSHAPFTLMASR